MTEPEPMKTMGEMKSWGHILLDLPPSCIEFCPGHPEYILVGTYNLQEGGEDYTGTANIPAGGQQSQQAGQAEVEEEPGDDEGGVPAKPEQSRNGSLILVRNDNNDIKIVQTMATPSAIFDLHFHPGAEHGNYFGAVSSTGTFIMGRLDVQSDNEDHEGPIRILSTSIIPDVGQDACFTSFAWHLPMTNGAAITTSTGQVWLVALDSRGRIRNAQQLPLISRLETWCVAFAPPLDKTEETMIYAGSDDSILRYTSFKTLAMTEEPSEDDKPLPSIRTRMGPEEGKPEEKPEDKPLPSIKSGDSEEARNTMLWEQSFSPGPHLIVESPNVQQLIKNEHNAGVTAILPLPPTLRDAGVIVTGSYDENIRVFLMENPHADLIGRPQQVFEQSLGGGVWRLQLMKFRVGEPSGTARIITADILASCMHAGPKIVRLQIGGLNVMMDVLHEFEDHTLNYASHCQIRDDDWVEFATTSFYDKKLHWWTWEPAA